ncbi:MAG: VWA domain-containing protein [Myxococcales bacterium]|nr:VWA domain-containing protein [Myxococcales bacterium]MCB9713147.1 VWA domain-containing protein [Myxococcales bacterium]
MGDSGETNPLPSSTSDATTVDGTTTNVGGTTMGMPADSTGGTTMGSSEDDATSIQPPKIDQGEIPDAPPVDDQCTMVDFLFVIDNSGSMSTYQANLIANFPTFINGIQTTLDGVDSYQVGVITTDEYFTNTPNCRNLSSLVVQSSGGVCGPYADGDNFMTEDDDLAMTFNCAANVGTSGSGLELPMQAMVEAVQEVDGGPGQCNEGFLRDDSLLVIVIITDEYDGPGDPEGLSSPGDPMTWYDDVVAARAGIPENIVVLSLINYMGGPCPPFSGYDDGVHIATFTELFGDNGFLGGICEPDYGPIFNQAIGVIDSACDNFMPPPG